MKNKKGISIKDVSTKNLKRFLRHGDMIKIAKKTGYTPNYVRMVLNPKNKRSNSEIIREAILLVEAEGFVELDVELADILTN